MESKEMKYTLEILEKLIATPSRVGYYKEMNCLVEELARKLGCAVEYDNKKTAYINIKGKNEDRTLCICAHMDTLGLMVGGIETNGRLTVRHLGGINYNNLDGESVTVITREGKKYSGLCVCKSHSTHVFDDARTAARTETNMMVCLDQKIYCRADVQKLGIRNGDHIYIEPHFKITENGFIKSRFLDNKAGVACVLSALKSILEKQITPNCNIMFMFPHLEELGKGGSYVPDCVQSLIAVDMAPIGPGYESAEDKVTICTKDSEMVYDYEFTSKLIELAEKEKIDYAIDAFYRYSSDAGAAVIGGNDVQAACLGTGVFCSHGMERTHVDSLKNTIRLLETIIVEY